MHAKKLCVSDAYINIHGSTEVIIMTTPTTEPSPHKELYFLAADTKAKVQCALIISSAGVCQLKVKRSNPVMAVCILS